MPWRVIAGPSSKPTANPVGFPFLLNPEDDHSHSPHCCYPGPSHPPLSPRSLLTGPLVSLLAWAAYFLL